MGPCRTVPVACCAAALVIPDTSGSASVEASNQEFWLATIKPTSGTDRAKTEPLTVRVIDYTIDDGREPARNTGC